jgi:hypothetical protein
VTPTSVTPTSATPTPLANWPGTGNFNGASTQFTLPDSALDTGPGASFTVSAWVYLTSTSNWATAVSQDGVYNSSFYLQYSVVNGAWAFSRVASDTSGADGIRAISEAPPVTGQWTHLVGVYDSSSQQLSLYVNGVFNNAVLDTTPYAGQGNVIVGRAESDAHDTDWFTGMIKDVEVFQQALTPAQIRAIP